MSNGKSGCAKGAIGCTGVGCFLVVAVIAASFAFSPQIKDLFERGLEKAKQAVEDHPVYREAMARAEADPRVAGKLGTPIEAGIPSTISLHREMGGAAKLEMEVGISGPDGEGRLEIEGSEKDEEVTFDVLVFRADGERVDLLASPGNLEAAPGSGDGR